MEADLYFNDNAKYKKNAFFYISALAIFLTMFFPDSFRLIRVFVFFTWTILALCRSHGKINRTGTYIVMLYLGANLISLCNGLLRGAPGAMRGTTVDFVWPVMFLLIAQGICTVGDIKHMIRVMIFSEYMICVFDIIYLSTQFLGISFVPGLNYLTVVLDCHFGNYGTFLQYTTTHMVTHIFMLPFLISLLITGKYKSLIQYKILISEIILLTICAVASSRVAFLLSSFISVCIMLAYYGIVINKRIRLTARKLVMIIFATFIFFVGIIVFLKVTKLDLGSSIDYIRFKFQTSNDPTHVDNGVRAIQKSALLDGWRELPLLGHGTGSYTEKCIRDPIQVWAYEYTYYAMLFQRGIVGVVAFFGFMAWILQKLHKAIRIKLLPVEFLMPFMFGLVGILIANYADPYLLKLGCMWMIYFPFAIACYANKEYGKKKNISGIPEREIINGKQ